VGLLGWMSGSSGLLGEWVAIDGRVICDKKYFWALVALFILAAPSHLVQKHAGFFMMSSFVLFKKLELLTVIYTFCLYVSPDDL
jgi:hypothetical protein